MLKETSPAPARSEIERLASLQQMTAELSRATTVEEVARAVVLRIVATVKATGGAIALLNQGQSELKYLSSTGIPEEAVRKCFELSADYSTPMDAAIKRQKPLCISSREQLSTLFPHSESEFAGLEDCVLVIAPLLIRGKVIGGFAATFSPHQLPCDADAKFMQVFVDLCAQALDRIMLYEQLESELNGRKRQTNGESWQLQQQREHEKRSRRSLETLLKMAEMLVQIPSEPSKRESEASQSKGLAELTLSIVGCQRVGIINIDTETDAVIPITTTGISAEQEQAWREFWSGATLRHPGHNSYLPIIRHLEEGNHVFIDYRQPPFNSIQSIGVGLTLAVPMNIGKKLIGCIFYDYGDRSHDFTEDEIALAKAVSRYAGLLFEREKLFAEREQARFNETALQEANRRLDEFMSIASHELKTPLTSMKANIQLAEKRMKKAIVTVFSSDEFIARQLDPMIQMLETANIQGNRLSRLIIELLDMSRIQSGHLEMQIVPCDLSKILKETIIETRMTWPEREIHISLPETRGIYIQADADRISQVISNFLSNAMKYSADSCPIEVKMTHSNGRVRVQVTDQGLGLSKEDQIRIWERFYRVQGTAEQTGSYENLRSSISGLGLGLYICKTIIERHNGRIGVESEPGQGATFWFEMPVAGV